MKSILIISVLLVSTCLVNLKKNRQKKHMLSLYACIKRSNEISLKDDLKKSEYILLETNDPPVS